MRHACNKKPKNDMLRDKKPLKNPARMPKNPACKPINSPGLATISPRAPGHNGHACTRPQWRDSHARTHNACARLGHNGATIHGNYWPQSHNPTMAPGLALSIMHAICTLENGAHGLTGHCYTMARLFTHGAPWPQWPRALTHNGARVARRLQQKNPAKPGYRIFSISLNPGNIDHAARHAVGFFNPGPMGGKAHNNGSIGARA